MEVKINVFILHMYAHWYVAQDDDREVEININDFCDSSNLTVSSLIHSRVHSVIRLDAVAVCWTFSLNSLYIKCTFWLEWDCVAVLCVCRADQCRIRIVLFYFFSVSIFIIQVEMNGRH